MAVDKESQLYRKPAFRWRMILVVSVTLATGLGYLYSFSRFQSNVQPQKALVPKTSPAIAVTALGRIQPQGEITRLSPPSSLSGVRVEKLLVKEGDRVQRGQL